MMSSLSRAQVVLRAQCNARQCNTSQNLIYIQYPSSILHPLSSNSTQIHSSPLKSTHKTLTTK